MTLVYVTLAVVGVVMLVETIVAVQHENALLARGATIPTGDIFSLMSVTYPVAYILMGFEGTDRVTDAWGPGPSWFFGGLAVFVVAKVLKYWAITSLGGRWTYRIMVLPGAPLLTGGPYRYVAHPNYVAIIGEMAGTAMMVGAPVTGSIGTIVFGLILLARIRFENRVLEAVRRGSSS